MIELKLLNPPPGAWTLPVMRYEAVDGTEDPHFVRLMFAAGGQRPDGQPELSMGVVISTHDATAILRSLQILQGKGLLPVVPQVPTSKQ